MYSYIAKTQMWPPRGWVAEKKPKYKTTVLTIEDREILIFMLLYMWDQ